MPRLTAQDELLVNSALSSGRITYDSAGRWALRLIETPRFAREVLAEQPTNRRIAEANWAQSSELARLHRAFHDVVGDDDQALEVGFAFEDEDEAELARAFHDVVDRDHAATTRTIVTERDDTNHETDEDRLYAAFHAACGGAP